MKDIIKRISNKGNAERYIILTVLTLLPLITCYAIKGIKLSEVYLPNSLLNDEIVYYKMIGAFAEHSGPLGYFGYNESHAAIGRLGPWSPFLLLPYVIYAKLIGWTLMSPIYCNIFILSVAMFVFAFIVQPDRRQTFYICIVYCLNYYYTRFILSAMTEVYIYALFLLFFSFSVGMFREAKKEKIHIMKYVIVLDVLAALMALARPYYILLFFIPGYYLYKTSHKRINIILQALISVVCMLLYFVCSKYCCAAYFSDIVKMEWLELIFSNPLLGVYNFLQIFVSSSYQLLHYVGDGIVFGYSGGCIWAVLLAVFFWIYYKWYKGDKEEKILWAYCFMYLSALILAMYYMYNIYNGSRHVAAFVFLAIFMVALFEKSHKIRLAIGILFVWCLCVRATDVNDYQIPIYTDEKADIIQQGGYALTNWALIDEDSNNPWDNTIIWTLELDFTYLYAIPDGMGINVCKQEYVQTNFEKLQSKYIMTFKGGVRTLCVPHRVKSFWLSMVMCIYGCFGKENRMKNDGIFKLEIPSFPVLRFV